MSDAAVARRLTEDEFFALPEAEQTRLLDEEDRAYTWRRVLDSVKTLQPVPRRKATVGFRVDNGPHVIHFRKHGRWWKWWIYCDGWSVAQRSGRCLTCVDSVQAALEAYVDMMCNRTQKTTPHVPTSTSNT